MGTLGRRRRRAGDPMARAFVPYGDVVIFGSSGPVRSVRTDLRTCPFKAARDGRMTLLRMSETTAAADSNETRKLCLLFVCSFLARSELEGKGGRPT